jgi:hypothetical protein
VTLVQQTPTDTAWEPDDFDRQPSVQQGDRDQARVLSRIEAAAADRLMGMSWQAVADRNGYASKGSVCTAVLGYLRRQTSETLGALRDQESARLDRAAAALWPSVLQGSARAQDTWLRNRASFRALHGLNAPLQVTLSSGAQAALADALSEAEALVLDVVAGQVTARTEHPAGWDDQAPTDA